MLLLLLSGSAPWCGLFHKIFHLACFTVLLQGYFCELRDPEHSCMSMHRSSLRNPKPIPDEEAEDKNPEQGFPEQQQLVSTSNGQLFLWPHKEEDRENDL